MGPAYGTFVPQLGYAAVKDAGQVGTSLFAKQLSGKAKCRAPARLDALGSSVWTFVLSVHFGCSSRKSTHYQRDRCQTLYKCTALYFIRAIRDFITVLYQFNQNQRDLYNFLVQKGMSDMQGQRWFISWLEGVFLKRLSLICCSVFLIRLLISPLSGPPASPQSTPAKALAAGSVCISSPRPAACAPAHSGDLPLSTNTLTVALKTPTTTASTPAKPSGASPCASPRLIPSSKMSIKHWVTRTPCSSPSEVEKKAPSPRKALAEVTQGLLEAACPPQIPHSQLEKRAKRRLDCSREADAGQKCLQACSCVIELDHAAKKSKLNLCHLVPDQKASDEDSLSLTDLCNDHEGSSHSPKEPSLSGSHIHPSGIQTSPHLFRSPCGKDTEVVDKENSSPERKNWLSALGEKLRTGRSGSQSSSNSPLSPCSPGAKRQESVATSPKTVSRAANNVVMK